MPRLTNKQARFVEEYLVDLNAAGAARRAGYTHRRSEAVGYDLLTKLDIQAAIQAAQRERSARTGITADRVVQELAVLAFADLADYVEWGPGGIQLKPSAALDATKRRAVIEVSENRLGVKIKLADKKGSLDSLGRHLGIYAQHADTEIVISNPRGSESA